MAGVMGAFKRALLPTLLSAFVCPGAGQLYNRDFRKGWVLIGASVLVMIGLGIHLSAFLRQAIPADASQIDFQSLREQANGLLRDPPPWVRSFNLFMTVVWIYSVVDAFLGAARPPAEPAAPGEDASG